GWHAKFNPPTVVNGKVYVASFGSDDGTDAPKLVCYGLLPAPTDPPSPPTSLTASAGTAQTWLNWTPSMSAASYKVLRGTSPGGPYSLVATVTTPSAIDSSLVDGTTYYYVVIASNSAGDSANSNEGAA